MNPFIKLLRLRDKRETYYGVVHEVNAGDRRVKLLLDNGVKVWIRYKQDTPTPTVRQRMLVNGEAIKTIVDSDVGRAIPRKNFILLV